MKRKEIAVTVLVCILLTAAGAWGVSWLYQIIFRPGSHIDEHTSDPDGWQDALAQYEKEILYPFPALLESGAIAESDGMYLLSDDYHIHQSLYSAVLELAGLDWAELEEGEGTAYDFQAGTAEYDEYGLRFLFHIAAAGEEGHENLVLAVNDSGLPVLFQYGITDKDAGEAGGILRSPVTFEGLPADTRDYISQIDESLGTETEYRLFLNDLASGITQEGEIPEITLAEYYKYGEWILYSDDSSAAYVGIVNDCNFILYYDLENGRFRGYSIALNPLG